jgi:putative AlgH/UPF0301 family transcriptional regulator
MDTDKILTARWHAAQLAQAAESHYWLQVADADKNFIENRRLAVEESFRKLASILGYKVERIEP